MGETNTQKCMGEKMGVLGGKERVDVHVGGTFTEHNMCRRCPAQGFWPGTLGLEAGPGCLHFGSHDEDLRLPSCFFAIHGTDTWTLLLTLQC